MAKKIIIIFGSIVVLAVIVGIVIHSTKPKPKVQKVDTFVQNVQSNKEESSVSKSENIDTTNLSEVNQKLGLSTTESSSDDESDGTDETTTDVSNVEVVKSTMQAYCAINLEDKALDTRDKNLKSQLPKELYESLKINSDTKTLKKMLATWKSKKELNTSESVQLLEQSIQSLKVYTNDTDANDFVVIATEQLKSPASPNTSIIVRQYSVTTSDNKVSAITKTSEVAGKK